MRGGVEDCYVVGVTLKVRVFWLALGGMAAKVIGKVTYALLSSTTTVSGVDDTTR